MTVKCLTQEQKETMMGFYTAKLYNQLELAKLFKTSERTINRVLVEAGIATAIPRLKGEAYTAIKLMEKHQVPIYDLEAMLILAKETMDRMYQEIGIEQEQQKQFEDVPF